jgi:hypothetical protein
MIYGILLINYCFVVGAMLIIWRNSWWSMLITLVTLVRVSRLIQTGTDANAH